MTKVNLIEQLATRTQLTKKDAEQVIEAVLGAIADALQQGERVDLRGFGSFQVSRKKERQGRNPKTGETLTIGARNVAVFKPGKELAERLNATPPGEEARKEDISDSALHAQVSEGPAKVHGDKIRM
jgi:integration host factor beta subunit